MRFIEGVDREQTVILPPTVEEYVAQDNPVRVLDAFVDKLDLVALGFTHASPEEKGRKPYAPADLLKLYVYGYLNKIRSSRQLEKACYRNLELIWLLRELRPDFKTIADFRKDNTAAIKKVCREFTLLCKKLELFGGELIAIDGSRFSAVNHNGRTYTREKLRKLLDEIDEKIETYFKGLDQNDQAETKIPRLRAEELKEQIARLKEHRAELEKLQAPLEASGDTQISLTDPDSRLMHSPSQGTDVGYNVQIVTDDKHQLIVEHEVTNDGNDTHQLANMALQAKATLGVESLEATADMGYFEKEEIKTCEDNNITCYIPKPEKSQNQQRGMFTEQAFHYDADHDRYACPANQELTFRYESHHWTGKPVKVYEGVACAECPLRSRCTRSQSTNRRLYRWIHQEVIERMQQRVLANPDKVKKRKELVEHPFGTIKHTMNQGYFLMRGLEKVSAEMSLSVLAYNMKRGINILGVVALIQALQ